ncbi:hypothetical protein [Natronomonas amylolytica]|uniref:hypothetical protein n=1 Tax=Natronomonas amylolytica TaxID=3108498 RepID=UPI00300A4C53
MSELADIHPTIQLDETVERKNESEHHWAIKAAITHRFRSDPRYVGTIETEKKTADLIGDVRCQLSESPIDVPRQFVVEVERSSSNKDRLRATIQHLRFGFDVYWIFTVDATDARRQTESLLGEHMSSPPSLGVASLPDGEISLGSPITWDEFEIPSPFLGQHEFYIPTYDRGVDCFDHGDFRVGDEDVTVYSRPERNGVYVSRRLDGGQRTLPCQAPWDMDEFLEELRKGDIKRISPVRGAP